MAEESNGYPKLSRTMWWALRERFKKALPTTVTPTFISTISQMTDQSARSNVLSPLRSLGLIDDDGSPTELARKWRDDKEYPEACKEMLTAIYPRELIEAFHQVTDDDEPGVISWFQRKEGVGEKAGRMYTQIFRLLTEADVSKREPTKSPQRTGGATQVRNTAKPSKSEKHTPRSSSENSPVVDPTDSQNAPRVRMPAVHVDLQIHISPETSAQQIDSIFESMAKHLGSYLK